MSSGNLPRTAHPELFRWSDGLDPARYVVARYVVTSCHDGEATATAMAMEQSAATTAIRGYVQPGMIEDWTIRVLYGPHGAPDFFAPEDIETFLTADWRVHYNSNRTGVRLVGPKPHWARRDGGEAGLHPSNIHDNPYAIGALDFTGDMPIILGPDGPTHGGVVCPLVVIAADLWKIGQLAPGDSIRFEDVSLADADAASAAEEEWIEGRPARPTAKTAGGGSSDPWDS